MAYMDTNTRQLERCAPGLETRAGIVGSANLTDRQK